MASMTTQNRVIRFALLSRALLLSLILLWRLFGRPYDTSASLNPPCLSAHPHLEEVPLCRWLGRKLEGSIVWDSVYYIRIAQCGYEYEQTFAFFPVFPLTIRLAADTVFLGFVPLVGYRATLAFSGYFISNVAFVFSAIFFYRMSRLILGDEEMAFQSTAFFCLNPASVFYSSIYSESLFSLFSFAGMWKFLQGSQWTSACLFALSGGIRSNGILHGGFLLFQAMHKTVRALYFRQLKVAAKLMFVAALQTAIVFAPFMAFQTYGYLKLCYETSKHSRPWCFQKIPYLYGFVQSYYWDVGFLRYFQLKQLPNFLLASPILSLAIWSIIAYAKYQPETFFSLGFYSSLISKTTSINEYVKSGKKESAPLEVLLRWRRNRKSHIVTANSLDVHVAAMAHTSMTGFFSQSTLPFLLEMAFMTSVACLIMHVQVATRFLSVCGPLYWFLALQANRYPRGYRFAYVVWGTLFSYILLGSLLFVNFYPFT